MLTGNHPTPESLTQFVARLQQFREELAPGQSSALDHLLDRVSGADQEVHITLDQIATFRDDGVVLVRRAMASWVDVLRSAVQRLIDYPTQHLVARPSRSSEARSVRDDEGWAREPALMAYVRWSPAASIARQLLGPEGDLVLTGVSIFGKEPGVKIGSPWHHDRPQDPIPCDRICNLWVALDVGDTSSGSVQIVKRSHLWNSSEIDARITRNSTSELAGIPGKSASSDHVDIASFEVEPGDLVCFDGRAIHGAHGNSTKRIFRASTTFWWAG